MSNNQIKEKINLIPLGGLGEIGKNMLVIEYNKDIIVIDAGLTFPEEDMLGIDLVIPDITYLVENKERIKAIFLTHGHEDHIGGLPYVLRQIDVPIYGTKLTLGLVGGKLAEHELVKDRNLTVITPGEKVQAGEFEVEFIKVSHSIPGAVAVAIHTSMGTILHTGDFKFDQTPVDGEVTDFHRLAELGNEGVMILLSDSTNSETVGYTMSEKAVGVSFDEMFREAKQRIIVATFASNVHRIQQVIDAAYKYKRKIAIAGRSIDNVTNIAAELGYLNIPEGMYVNLDDIDKVSHDKLVILTTGSQGEPMSALRRMANNDHKKVNIVPGDTVIISASPIPGNEKLIAKTINDLFKLGANVIYKDLCAVHVSGHASQEEQKLMLNLVKPKFFIPVHGEYRHLVFHAQLAKKLGLDSENIFILENGKILEITPERGKVVGKVPAGNVLIDGYGVGDVGNIVLRDRRQLSRDGIVIVVVTIEKEMGNVLAGPDIVSRGFVYVRESEALMEDAKDKVRNVLEKCEEMNITEWSVIKSQVRDVLRKYLYERTKRKPMILPIIMEV
ncbi:MAG: ribonuclease J [bacterium]